MTVKAFFDTHAGKGTAAVFAAGLFILFPPALSWLVAAGCLAFSARQFRESFRLVDEENAPRRDGDPQPSWGQSLEAAAVTIHAGGDGRRLVAEAEPTATPDGQNTAAARLPWFA